MFVKKIICGLFFKCETSEKRLQINLCLQNSSVENSHLFCFSETSPDYFVFGVYQPMKTLEAYPCEVASIAKDYRKIGNGFIFQQNWPYTRLINFHILKVLLI